MIATMTRALALAAVFSALAAGPLRAQDEPVDARALIGEVQRIVTAGGIDESRAVTIGGIQQWITVRGRDRRNPILLVLHGGPAAPEMSTRYLFEAPWTDYFTVVEWDQRGSGKTMAMNDAALIGPTISQDRMVADTVELVAYLRTTYDRDKIFAMGHSWGTILGLRLAQERPEWLHAYIGAGQIIDMHAGEAAGYRFGLDAARADGNTEAIAQLEGIAPYPELDGALNLDKLIIQRTWSIHYGGLVHGRDTYSFLANAQAISPDYSEADLEAIGVGSRLSLPALLPGMATTDFSDVDRLEVPLIIFAGRHDFTTPSEVVADWFGRVDAPYKRFVWFEHSAHMMFVEEPGKVLVNLVDKALPLAAAVGDVAPPAEAF